jgi:cytochrome c2
MKLLAALFLGAGALAMGVLASSHAQGTPDGKEIFLAQKCNMCHSVSSAGIEATTKSEKMKGPDLTGIMEGKETDAVAKFITKETDKEGKKHPKEFKGTAEELNALIAWLIAQKTAP